jgi:hypothetical protein
MSKLESIQTDQLLVSLLRLLILVTTGATMSFVSSDVHEKWNGQVLMLTSQSIQQFEERLHRGRQVIDRIGGEE